MFREYIPNEEFVSFFSNAKEPYNKLSNFALISDTIKVFKEHYISSEHAFQSRKYDEIAGKRFSRDGDLGNIEGFDIIDASKDYWMKKNNVGIIAKMATNKKNEKKLKLNRKEDFESTYKLWKKILKKKFKIPEFREILLITGDKYLLEFARDAETKGYFWGGLIKNGVLYGENTMGKYLMKIRDKIRKKMVR